MNPPDLLSLASHASDALPWVWTLLLLMVRYVMLLTVLPGTGLGMAGAIVRVPESIVFSIASMYSGSIAPIPPHWFPLVLSILSEAAFGTILGLMPLLIVSGVQLGSSIASTTMGLSASNLIDPTSGGQIPDVARIYGDLMIVIFISVGGYLSIIHVASGIGGTFIPGQPFSYEGGAELLIKKSGDLFSFGVIVSAPVVVALLLTQFVMGMISRAVPTVNIFIISFPLTIGIGLILSSLVLPEVVGVFRAEVKKLDGTLISIVETRVTDPKKESGPASLLKSMEQASPSTIETRS